MTTKDNRTPTLEADPRRSSASGQDSQPTNTAMEANSASSAAPNLPTTQLRVDNHGPRGGGDQTPGHNHRLTDSQTSSVVSGPDFTNTQICSGAQPLCGVGDQTSPAGHVIFDTQARHVGGGPASQCDQLPCGVQVSSVALGPVLASPLLGMAADVVDDLERVRIANENRYRTLTADDEHGHGLSPDHPDVARLSAIVDALAQAEKDAVKNLQKVMKAHPLGPFVKSQAGLGEKQAARLLAVIRDPYWNDLHNRPRTVSELWAYCGLHVLHPGSHTTRADQSRTAAGVAPKRQRGQKANWNEDARKRVWLIAASCVKQPAERSHYRRVYDATRAKYADAVHNSECVRCGPKGKPAQPGSPLSLGHQHARGLRAVAKEVLRDLWIEARRLHTTEAAEENAA